jgi:hypothetical protein
MTKGNFWITNITKKAVSISDLGTTLQPYKSINLLGSKNSAYTIEQIELSLKEGSLFQNRNRVKIRQSAPEKIESKVEIFEENNFRADKVPRSQIDIIIPQFEELDISEEEFINEFTEFDA